MSSSRFFKLVVPTMGAEIPSFCMLHAAATWAIVTPRFLAISSTLDRNNVNEQRRSVRQGTHLSMIAFEPAPLYVLTHGSSWLRFVCGSVPAGRQSVPRARGDQGIAPTPNICQSTLVAAEHQKKHACLQCRYHLALFLAI